MPKLTPRRELAFLIHDVARLLKTEADRRVRTLGMTRAQWAVLARLERCEGLKQSELAEALEIKPITLTRLVDRLCASGLVERRADPADRRAKRLFLAAAARPLVDRLADLGDAMMRDVLAGVDDQAVGSMIGQLLIAKENLRAAGGPRPAAAANAAA